MTSVYVHSPSRSRRNQSWRRWLLVMIGLAALFLAPALAHSQIVGDSVEWLGHLTAPASSRP